MFKKLLGKISGRDDVEHVIVPKSDPEYREQQFHYYMNLLRLYDDDPEQPVAFRDLLRVVRFDFSKESLEILDEILLCVRLRLTVDDFDEFVSTIEGLNFIVALGYYLGGTAAKLSQLPVAWTGYEKALKYNPSLPERLDTDIVCLLGDAVTFPANVIAGLLFNPVPERTCETYVKSLVRGESITDNKFTRLEKAHNLVTLLRNGELIKSDALKSFLDLDIYVPNPTPMFGRPPGIQDWQPLIINNESGQIAYTSLHYAKAFKSIVPDILCGVIIPFSWLVQNIASDMPIGINVLSDHELIISSKEVSECKKHLENARNT